MNLLKKTPQESIPEEERHKQPSCGTMKNIGRRSEQQDCVAVSDINDPVLCQQRGVFLTLADGMGGMSNGAQVSSMLIQALQNEFRFRPVDAEPDRWMLELVGEANRQVNAYLDGKAPSGSTLVAAIIKENKLHFLTIGDSRIYLVRGGGVIPLNRIHNYGQKLDLMLLKDILPAAALATHPQRAALTGYVGMGDLENIDRSSVPITLQPGDTVLLLSDGVFGTLDEKEIASCVCSTADITAIRMERMVLAKNHPRQDNFSAAIYQYE